MAAMTRRSLLSCSAAAALVAVTSQAKAADPDPWFGRDKSLHFAATSVIAAGGYTIGAAAFDARYKALILGGAAAIAAGTGKELADMAGFGDPSWRDFTWDLIGTVVGLGLAWTLDLAARGAGHDHPPLGTATHAEALRGGLVLSF
jgi:putative lipoprotein